MHEIFICCFTLHLPDLLMTKEPLVKGADTFVCLDAQLGILEKPMTLYDVHSYGCAGEEAHVMCGPLAGGRRV
jgi:hypothetical protein